LETLHHLLIEGRVSRVAHKLGVSQPAVSNSLARLRKLLEDELFVRTSRGMEPTPYAAQLGQSVGQALELIRTALHKRSHFEPGTSERTFTVGMTDIGEIYFLPSLLAHLGRVAPGVRLSTVRNTAATLKEDLADGRVDLAIGLLPELQAGFFQQRLFSQRYVCLMRRDHALAQRRLSLKDFSAAGHVVVVASGTGHHEADDWMAQRGIRRDVRLVVPHFVAIGHILQSSDLIATVPERLAQRMTGPFGLVSVKHPAPLPQAAIHVFWHARFQRDPANQWMRGCFFDLFSGD
jgi:DNA-binding transcriptional LysR family regulator